MDRFPLQVIGLNIGTLIQAVPEVVGEVVGEPSAIVAAKPRRLCAPGHLRLR